MEVWSVFDLEFNGIHLTQVIFKLVVVDGQNIIDVPVCEIKSRRHVFLKWSKYVRPS